MAEVRVDKWLWAVRIFKSRTLASNVCKANKVRVNDKVAKASTNITEGDTVIVFKNGFNFTFLIKKIIGKRVGAPIAIECYENITPQEELLKYESWFVGKSKSEFREKGLGRPTKRERREIDDYKENAFDLDWDDED